MAIVANSRTTKKRLPLHCFICTFLQFLELLVVTRRGGRSLGWRVRSQKEDGGIDSVIIRQGLFIVNICIGYLNSSQSRFHLSCFSII